MITKQYTSAYFIGIGGIGMSALARALKHLGVQVKGYDHYRSPLCKELEMEGFEILYKDEVALLPDDIFASDRSDLMVVYTPAIPKDNEILNFFIDGQYDVYKRAALLGELSKNSPLIAVGGTHGKTTTSCLLAHCFYTANHPFMAILGGISRDLGSNFYVHPAFVWGEHPIITEADEYDRSFLQLHPKYGIITASDSDHMEVYGKADEVVNSFVQFADQTEVVFAQNHTDSKVLASAKWSYGIGKGDFCANNIQVKEGRFTFDFKTPETISENWKLSLPGNHNIENAVAALSVCKQFDLNENFLKTALYNFKGVRRRYDRILQEEKAILIDDYAHHPAEITAAINATSTLFPEKKILVIFQPHLYSRTRDFVDGFAESLGLADSVWLLPVYPAREQPIEGVDSYIILEKMQKGLLKSKEEVVADLKCDAQTVYLVLGAGDIGEEVEKYKQKLLEC